jgi:hypothetical protein
MLPYVVAHIETGVPWPTEETKVSFSGQTLRLLPETPTLAPAVVLTLEPPLDEEGGVRLVKQFLTALAWVHRQPVRELMTAPQGPLVRVGKPPPAGTLASEFYEEYLPVPDDARARFALALYRQALGVNDVGYECLGYFRIMQIVHSGSSLEAWLDAAVSRLTDHEAQQRLPRLAEDAAASSRTVGQYLYGLRRSALAHGNPTDPVDPDERADTRFLHEHKPVIRALAELVIVGELGVQSAREWRQESRSRRTRS